MLVWTPSFERASHDMTGRLPHIEIAGLRPSALLELYRWHLREHAAQELLAGTGVAIGVALFFGVLVANSSLINSASQLIHAVTGNATLQLSARSSEGFPEAIADEVRRLPDVTIAAPLLRENGAIVGPRGRAEIQLVGLTPSQLALRGSATRNLGAGGLLLANGIGLPAGLAGKIGAQPERPVSVYSNGEAHRASVRAVLGTQTVGTIATSPLVVALLPLAQRLSGHTGRITQVLIEPAPGHRRLVERELRKLAAGRLDVQPATHELTLLEATANPTNQSADLFAAVSAMVGFVLALNAMLLTVPERRRFVADLRQQGFGPRQVLLTLTSQAVFLGLLASIAGVALGDTLSRSLFHEVPSYLTFAFPIGSHPVIPLGTVLLALLCGVLATLLATLLPLLGDLRHDRSAETMLRDNGEAGHSISQRAIATAAIGGATLVVVVSVVVFSAPGLSVAGGVLLAIATFCLIMPLYWLLLRVLKPASERVRRSMLPLAVVELDATATRSVALAGIAAVAVYGMLAVQGARSNLINGLNSAVVQYLDTADLWVTTDNNFLTIDPFDGTRTTALIAHVRGIASVREYQGSLLDVGTRRLWIRARPPDDTAMIQASQLLQGSLAQATHRLREGGWAAISNGYASEHGLRVGDMFTLPTPSGPARLRVAAITTNVGWPPGAITVNSNDYSHYWQTTKPTALEINLDHGIAADAARRAVIRVLANQPGLQVQTFAERRVSYEESARQGIRSLSQIATLLLVATSLAIAAALSAAILQRRARLSSLKSDGFDSRQLWRSLLLESTILIGIGCLDGAVLGIYGHVLASRWLKLSVGFPAPFTLGLGLVLLTLALITTIALAVIAFPGLIAARVQPHVGFQE
jgi:putative ABC transport system permease protein